MRKSKTHEEFLSEIRENNEHFDDFEFLTKYVNARTKITYRCKVCDNVTSILPASLLKGNQCKICSQRKGRGNNYFFEKVNELKDKIDFLNVAYENCYSKIECCCKICNNEWTTTAHSLIYSKTGCPYCSHKIINEDNSVYIARPDLRKYFTGDWKHAYY